METRVALIGIMVKDMDSVSKINETLHEFSSYIIGRMGIPYAKKNVNIISIVVDAPADTISSLSGKLGRLKGINTKVLYAKAES